MVIRNYRHIGLLVNE